MARHKRKLAIWGCKYGRDKLARISFSKLFCIMMQTRESANYFFHYTWKIDHLISIMTDNFMPFYCMEGLEFLNYKHLQLEGMAYPVVCFCDLPITRQKEHVSKFGGYGIALKKEWGIKKHHLTPIVYSHKGSLTSATLKGLIEIAKRLQEKLTKQEFQIYNNLISVLMMHYKPYEGYPFIKTETRFSNELRCFYDEREWRYIPLNCDGLKLNLSMDEYKNKEILDKENKKIQEDNRLEFGVDDIEFLFLKDKSEIDQFLNKLKPKYSEQELLVIRKKINKV